MLYFWKTHYNILEGFEWIFCLIKKNKQHTHAIFHSCHSTDLLTQLTAFVTHWNKKQHNASNSSVDHRPHIRPHTRVSTSQTFRTQVLDDHTRLGPEYPTITENIVSIKNNVAITQKQTEQIYTMLDGIN